MLIPNGNGYYRNNVQLNNGRVEKIIYPESQSQSQNNSLKNVLLIILTVFLLGLTAIVLMSVYDAVYAYKPQINRLIYSALITGVMFFLAFVAGMLYLVFESKSAKSNQKQNELSESQLAIEDNQPDSFKELVVATFDNMKEKNCYSQTQLAMAVFGNKGSHYSNQLRDILAEYGREF